MNATATQTERTEWTTIELTEDFEVLGFSYGIVIARKKSDGKRGPLIFGGSPRIYSSWNPEEQSQK